MEPVKISWPEERHAALLQLLAELIKRGMAAKVVINLKPGEIAKLEVSQYF